MTKRYGKAMTRRTTARQPGGQPSAMPRIPRPVRTRPPVSRKTWIVRGLGAFVLLTLVTLLGLWAMWGRNLPSVAVLDVLEFSGQTRVYDRTGKFVGTLTPSLNSGTAVNDDLLKISEISPKLQKAVVTNEDRRFYEHHGIDPIGIARGLINGLTKNKLQGGSSITTQVVKNTLLAELEGAPTLERKFKEVILASQLDRSFSKEKILGSYLNVIYWGDSGRNQIIGAGMAARAYFRKNAADLNLAESVYLTTLIPGPNTRYKKFKEYRPYMQGLLDRMLEDGRITKAQAVEAWRTPIYPSGWRIAWNADGSVASANLERPERLQENLDETAAKNPDRYKYYSYLQAVGKELLGKVDPKELYGGGKIYTGMDIAAQEAAEAASRRARLPYKADLGLALVNPQNGEVLGLVGQKLTAGRPSEWNNALKANRQVGSSIKPLLYTLALQEGWKQSDKFLDAPIEEAGSWNPKNYNGRWTGSYMTMRMSLDRSLNLTTVRVAQEVGLNKFENKLRDMGLSPTPDLGLSVSIGTLQATPLEMAAAYATFANGGLYYSPSFVRRFENKVGKVTYTRPAPQPRRVWDAQTAWLGLDMLKGVVYDFDERAGGLATKARIDGWEVGGKTGTTNEIKDLWFAGVTPLISGAVWVGREDNARMPEGNYSGDIAAPIWQDAVSRALADRPKETFQEPPGIAYKEIRFFKVALRSSQIDEEQKFFDGHGQKNFFGQRQAPVQAPDFDAPTQDNTVTPPPLPLDNGTTPSDPATQPTDPVPSDPLTPTEPVQPDPNQVNPNPAPTDPVQTDPVQIDPVTPDPNQPDPNTNPVITDPNTSPVNPDQPTEIPPTDPNSGSGEPPPLPSDPNQPIDPNQPSSDVPPNGGNTP